MSRYALSPDDAALLEAIVARIFPGDATNPGAREIGVVDYIDRALAGAYASLQTFYRLGLAATEAYARERFGRRFVDLEPDEQDTLLTHMEDGIATGFADEPAFARASEPDSGGRPTGVIGQPSGPEFFAVVRQHTMEGLFADPLYGGNRDMLGWRAIGYPGARFGYTAEEMRPGTDLSRLEPMSLDDLDAFYRDRQHEDQ